MEMPGTTSTSPAQSRPVGAGDVHAGHHTLGEVAEAAHPRGATQEATQPDEAAPRGGVTQEASRQDVALRLRDNSWPR